MHKALKIALSAAAVTVVGLKAFVAYQKIEQSHEAEAKRNASAAQFIAKLQGELSSDLAAATRELKQRLRSPATCTTFDEASLLYAAKRSGRSVHDARKVVTAQLHTFVHGQLLASLKAQPRIVSEAETHSVSLSGLAQVFTDKTMNAINDGAPAVHESSVVDAYAYIERDVAAYLSESKEACLVDNAVNTATDDFAITFGLAYTELREYVLAHRAPPVTFAELKAFAKHPADSRLTNWAYEPGTDWRPDAAHVLTASLQDGAFELCNALNTAANNKLAAITAESAALPAPQGSRWSCYNAKDGGQGLTVRFDGELLKKRS